MRPLHTSTYTLLLPAGRPCPAIHPPTNRCTVVRISLDVKNNTKRLINEAERELQYYTGNRRASQKKKEKNTNAARLPREP